MTRYNRKIGFIGAGNMAEAMIGAWVRGELFPSDNIHASDIMKERVDFLVKTYGITPFPDNFSLFASCDIIILAVKPQQMEEVLKDLVCHQEYEKTGHKIILSIAAGIRIQKIQSILYAPLKDVQCSQMPIFRAMPNTPCLVLSGMTGLAANPCATEEQCHFMVDILSSMGRVIRFEEEDLDAVTALSGSGPAYVFYFMESLMEAGVRAGLSDEDAKDLTLTTIHGALLLLQENNLPPSVLREKVTSPGGTTQAAIQVMEEKNLKEILADAVLSAKKRSLELSK